MRDADDPLWQKVLGCLLLPVVLPLAIVVIPILNALGLNKSRAGPDQLVQDLSEFLEGTEGGWALDDFSSVPFADQELEDIRERACDYLPPLTLEDRQQLESLIEEARALEKKRGQSCS
jgi:hypothetical protein